MIIGIPVYDDVDRLDVAGPYEMFNWMKVAGSAVDVQVIAATDKVTTRDGLTPMSHKTFEQVNRVDVLWVPGGDPSALALMMSDPDSRYLKFLQAMSKTARVVASVCEGACCWPRLDCSTITRRPPIGCSFPASSDFPRSRS